MLKTILIIVAVIAYIAVIPFAYRKCWDDSNSKFENVWFACIWPLMLIGWLCTGWTKAG